MNVDQSIYRLMKERNENALQNVALSQNGKTLTYGEFFCQVEKFAHGLSALGIAKNDVVALCLPNVIEAVVALYAINEIGAIANVIHPLTPAEGLKKIFTFTETKLVIGLPNAENCGVLAVVYGKKAFPSDLEFGEVFTRSAEFEPKTDSGFCMLLHSGGTLGEPKTIMLSDSQINSVVAGMEDFLSEYETEGVGVLAALPLFHGYGLANTVHTFLCLRSVVHLVPVYDKNQTPEYLVDNKIGVVFGVPSMYENFLDNEKFATADKSFLKVLFAGGDTVSGNLLTRFNDCLSSGGSHALLCAGYGLTECVAACVANKPSEFVPGSVGRPFFNMQVGVFDDDRFALPCGEKGEVCVCSPSVMLGYFKDEKATAKTLVVHDDGKTWLHTGDVGYLDEKGFLHFVTRKKRIAKVNGFTVFPSEVEEVISAVDGVKRVAVVPSEKSGKTELVAFVVGNGEVTETDIASACAKKLIKWSHPRKIVFCESFPLTQNGKTDYLALEKSIG